MQPVQSADRASVSQLGLARSAHLGAGDRARLRIEGVSAPIVTTVARRRTDALIVVQDLPFLRLNARVRDENDRDARIARVAVDLEHDVPRLVLELTYDDVTDEHQTIGGSAVRADVGEVEVEAAETVEAVEAKVATSLEQIERSWDRRDDTLGYGTQRPDRPSRVGAALARRDRGIENTLLFQTEMSGARADDSVRTTSPWMQRRGNELQLGVRAFWARAQAAIDIVARALDQVLAALRTDP